MATNEQLDTAIATLGNLVDGVRLEQLTDSTPCSKWTVRDLLNHVIGGGHMFAGGFRGDPLPDLDGEPPDMVGDNPSAAWRAAAADFYDGVESPGAMDRMIMLPIGEVPAPIVLQIAGFDLLVHCWDLAKATGQPYPVPDSIIVQADAAARQMISPEMRGPLFGPEVSVPDSASAVQKFVAFTGREP